MTTSISSKAHNNKKNYRVTAYWKFQPLIFYRRNRQTYLVSYRKVVFNFTTDFTTNFNN